MHSLSLGRPGGRTISLCASPVSPLQRPLLAQFGQHCRRRTFERQRSWRRFRCSSGARHLELHIGDTTVAFPLGVSQGQELQQAMQQLLQTFAEKQKQERPKRYKSMEYRFQGAPDKHELKQLELFCNPNASSNAFTAKVLISLQTHDGVKFTTEGPLTNIRSDIDTFVEHASRN